MYTICFKDLRTGETLPDEIEGADCNFAWAGDGRTLFYAHMDPVSIRAHKVCRHVVGTRLERDVTVYREADPAFRCMVVTSRDQDCILINTFSGNSEEYLFIPADRPRASFRVICPRSEGQEYDVEHWGGAFFIRTNLDAVNYKICQAQTKDLPTEEWDEVVAPCDGVFIEKFAVIGDYIAMIKRRDGMARLCIFDRLDGSEHEVVFDEPVYEVWIEPVPLSDDNIVHIGYTSLKTPLSFYDYDMKLRKLDLVWREHVPGFNPDDYVAERHWVPSDGDVKVPLSVVYRRDMMQKGGCPLLLFGYGAYGTNIPTFFDQSRLALLNRGFVFAMAHVRGGTEMGREWYMAGRLMAKKNTFTDFIACAEYLVERGIARRDKLFAESLSAGGLLLGATVNMRPDLFKGVIAVVPFVDLLNSMSDPSIPLTSSEYAEWGDPSKRDEWEYMRSYSPYDNVEPRSYPHMLITASLNDSQVVFWEAAKWAARLRKCNTAATNILLKTNMEAGHDGTPGRIKRLGDTAFLYAFLLDLAGIRK